MNQIFNQYSAMWIAAGLFVVVAYFLLRNNPKTSNIVALVLIAAGLIVAWVTLRPTQTPMADNVKAVQRMIGQGEPVLLEFQSPY